MVSFGFIPSPAIAWRRSSLQKGVWDKNRGEKLRMQTFSQSHRHVRVKTALWGRWFAVSTSGCGGQSLSAGAAAPTHTTPKNNWKLLNPLCVCIHYSLSSCVELKKRERERERERERRRWRKAKIAIILILYKSCAAEPSLIYFQKSRL